MIPTASADHDLFRIFTRQDRIGYINRIGQVVIEPKFKRALWFFGEMAPALLSGRKYGYIDRTGEFVIAPRFDQGYGFSERTAAVSLGKKATHINEKGEFLYSHFYRLTHPFSEGLAPVAKNEDCWGFVNRAGEEVIPPRFNEVRDFTEEYAAVAVAAVAVKERWGYVDRSGNLAISPQYEGPVGREFSAGLAAVRQRGRWGFINPNNEFVIEPRFEDARSFTEGLAPVFWQICSAT